MTDERQAGLQAPDATVEALRVALHKAITNAPGVKYGNRTTTRTLYRMDAHDAVEAALAAHEVAEPAAQAPAQEERQRRDEAHAFGFREGYQAAERALATQEEGLDVAYRERNAVVAALIRTNGWPAEVVMAPDTAGWFIVYAETPQGQVSWHISPDDMDLFRDWPVAFGTRPSPWDGHTTEEKYRRVAALRALGTKP